MEYRIECIQTVFGKERERRLKLVFDIIWNLTVGVLADDEIEEESNEEEKNLPSEAEQEL